MKVEISDLSVTETVLDRREFFVGAILAGAFALAVQPIAAQTRITTDTNGLYGGRN